MDRQSPSPAEMYERYFVPGIFARWTPLLLERTAPRRGECVLDVACGTGVVARQVAPLVGEEGMVVGLDASPDMLKVARALSAPQGAAIEWQEGDATSLPEGPFDLILCQQGLQFFAGRAEALKEMHRVLKPGGRVALSTWKGLDHQPLYATLLEAEARYLDTSVDVVAGPPFSLGDADELRRLFEEAGFDDIEISSASHTVRFPEPERFVTLTTLASAAVLPEFSNMDDEERSAMVDAISREIETSVREYVDGNEVAFPMHANITVAYAR